MGFGIGFGWPHLLTRILQVAPEADKDIAGASITTVQLFATAFGAALAGMTANLAAERSGRWAASAARWRSSRSRWRRCWRIQRPRAAIAPPGAETGNLYKPRPRASARMALIQRR